MQDIIVEIYTGYKAFSIPPGNSLADPYKEFTTISSPESVAKGVLTVILSMFSDIIIVRTPHKMRGCHLQ